MICDSAPPIPRLQKSQREAGPWSASLFFLKGRESTEYESTRRFPVNGHKFPANEHVQDDCFRLRFHKLILMVHIKIDIVQPERQEKAAWHVSIQITQTRRKR